MLSVNSSKDLTIAHRCVRFARVLLLPLYIIVLIALYCALIYAPTEAVMGEVQRIFYFHVGAAWTALYVAFFMVFVSGIAYLKTRRRIWDHVGATCAEVGLAFTTINLLTGIFWARPIWGTWWPWGDPRVTTVLLLWLIYVAYIIFRINLPEGEKKYRYCAIFGIIGFIDVPIVTISIRVWRTIHPVVITATEMRLENRMIVALLVAIVAFSVLFLVLVALRMAMRIQSAAIDEMSRRTDQTLGSA